MQKELKITQLMHELEEKIAQFPDPRTGKNSQYEIVDVGMSAFSVFFTQSPSFLSHQRDMKLSKGSSNAERLFGLQTIPSDNQIRNLLDHVDPSHLASVYRSCFVALERSGILDKWRSYGKQLLVAIDGTEYHSSSKIHCENCNHRELRNGTKNYYHSVLTPVIVQAGNEKVISLEPEFIVPQDGHEKQDCEIAAAKRWIQQYGAYYARQGVIILGDDLFSRQPFCKALKEQKLHYILVCKPESHEYLYETVAFLAGNGVLGTRVVRNWVGKYAEISTYRYTNQLPLYADQDALEMGWCEITVTREDSGEKLYQNAFVTDFEVTESTVEAIVRDGRARWKVENENNNVLKTKGYHIEHNFGHGDLHLSSLLLSLNLLAFLFHTILDMVDEEYQAIRQALGTRQKFFQDMEALMRYFLFENWEHLLSFMFKGLELDTG